MSEYFLNPLQAARSLADKLMSDISKASTREEHIRLTARANEAVHLANLLDIREDDGK